MQTGCKTHPVQGEGSGKESLLDGGYLDGGSRFYAKDSGGSAACHSAKSFPDGLIHRWRLGRKGRILLTGRSLAPTPRRQQFKSLVHGGIVANTRKPGYCHSQRVGHHPSLQLRGKWFAFQPIGGHPREVIDGCGAFVQCQLQGHAFSVQRIGLLLSKRLNPGARTRDSGDIRPLAAPINYIEKQFSVTENDLYGQREAVGDVLGAKLLAQQIRPEQNVLPFEIRGGGKRDHSPHILVNGVPLKMVKGHPERPLGNVCRQPDSGLVVVPRQPPTKVWRPKPHGKAARQGFHEHLVRQLGLYLWVVGNLHRMAQIFYPVWFHKSPR